MATSWFDFPWCPCIVQNAKADEASRSGVLEDADKEVGRKFSQLTKRVRRQKLKKQAQSEDLQRRGLPDVPILDEPHDVDVAGALAPTSFACTTCASMLVLS